MKNLFIGIAVGILASILFLYFSSSFVPVKSSVDYTSGQEEESSYEDVIPENTSEDPSVSEKHRVAIDYISNNLDALLAKGGMEKFMVESPYPFSAALYAVKNENLDLWESYWLSLYDSLEQKPFERDLFQNKIVLAFDSILRDELEMEDYKEYLLDGAVYFSTDTIQQKILLCNEVFNSEDIDVASDGIKYCQSMSYLYEAIRTDNIQFCSEIQFTPENTALVENCEALFNDK